MAFDIEKMKADGVSSHLIELASMSQETFLLLIARRLEHDKIFQQFMGQNASSIEAMYPYAVAAGLMSEYDRLWLIDEDNPYKEEEGEIWYTGTLGECDEGYARAELSETDKANTTDLRENPEDYSISVNGVSLAYVQTTEQGTVDFMDSAMTAVFSSYENGSAASQIKCPTDITTVEVTVSHN